jgi:hypothetical protein
VLKAIDTAGDRVWFKVFIYWLQMGAVEEERQIEEKFDCHVTSHLADISPQSIKHYIHSFAA